MHYKFIRLRIGQNSRAMCTDKRHECLAVERLRQGGLFFDVPVSIVW